MSALKYIEIELGPRRAEITAPPTLLQATQQRPGCNRMQFCIETVKLNFKVFCCRKINFKTYGLSKIGWKSGLCNGMT